MRIALPDVDPLRAEAALMDADIAVIPGGHPNKLISGLAASPLTDLAITKRLDGMAITDRLPAPWVCSSGESSSTRPIPFGSYRHSAFSTVT